MKPLLALVAALACGVAGAQQASAPDGGAMCRSFCDADAKQCRKDAAENAANETDPLFEFRGTPRADKDDGSAQKLEQAQRAAERDRFAGAQKCTQARMVCRQRCSASPAH